MGQKPKQTSSVSVLVARGPSAPAIPLFAIFSGHSSEKCPNATSYQASGRHKDPVPWPSGFSEEPREENAGIGSPDTGKEKARKLQAAA